MRCWHAASDLIGSAAKNHSRRKSAATDWIAVSFKPASRAKRGQLARALAIWAMNFGVRPMAYRSANTDQQMSADQVGAATPFCLG